MSYYLQQGLTLQEKHRLILNNLYNPLGVTILPTTDYQDKALGMDYIWQYIFSQRVFKYSDFKTKKNEESDVYNLTSYTKGFHHYVFHKTKSIDYIFLSGEYYYFVFIKDVQKWYEERHSFINDYENCGDWPSIQPNNDSKYYKLPLSEVEKLCYNRISFTL